jgi:D-alanyl-lipoteichoic acid acyltransferase DltB (MBOAT superfamily)
MLFNSPSFLFIFFPVTIVLYVLIKKFYNKKLILLTFFSLISFLFYSLWNIFFLPLIIFSILFNFYISKLIIGNFYHLKKTYLCLGILINIFFLFIFKYTDFFILNLNFFLSTNYNLFNLIYPLGLSFYTIEQIAYLIDCYENKSKNSNILEYSVYVTFFSHLLAGPILIYKNFIPELKKVDKKYNFNNCLKGFLLIFIGLSKKILIADPLLLIVNKYFDPNFVNLSFLQSWVGSIALTFQIYFDFSGYTDIALGIALIFMIKFPNNFDSPFQSKSMIEFWNRWHITLSNFINYYMYRNFIKLFNNINLLNSSIVIICVMFIAGIWHGPSWGYAVFGLFHGIGIVINHYWRVYGFKLSNFLNWFITFNFVNFTFIIFKSQNITVFLNFVKKMYLIDFSEIFENINNFASNLEMFISVTFLIFCFIIIFNKYNSFKLFSSKKIPVKIISIVSIFGAITLFKMLTTDNSEAFIYFNF